RERRSNPTSFATSAMATPANSTHARPASASRRRVSSHDGTGNRTRPKGDPKMFKTKNDLAEAVRVKVVELLNARLADAGDLDTADLFTEVSRGIDKWLWFVEAHAQAER